MKKPIVGEPLTFSEYLKTRSSYHALRLIGGAIWGVGTVFNFVAASLVGVAICYAIEPKELPKSLPSQQFGAALLD